VGSVASCASAFEPTGDLLESGPDAGGSALPAEAGSRTEGGAAAAPAACTTPWGATLPSGAEVIAYAWVRDADAAADAGSGTCVAETRQCHDGVLAGTNAFDTCAAAEPDPCTLPWGGVVAPGQSVTAYRAGAPAWNQKCEAETRGCTDGVLSGSFASESCKRGDPPGFVCDPNQNVLATVSCGTIRCFVAGKLRLTFANGQSTITRATATFTTTFPLCASELVCTANPATNRMDCTIGGQSFSLPLDPAGIPDGGDLG
jgi:hypothetical protein